MARTTAVYVGENRVLTRTANGFKMYVDARDVSISPHLILDGVWEEWTESTLRRVIKPGMRILEIGANVGYFTLLLARLAGASGSVYAFECDPELAQTAADNIEMNGFTSTVTIDRRAVGGHGGVAEFRRALRHRGGGTLVGGLQQIPQLTEGERETLHVEMTTVDELLQSRSEAFDFVKIDAEGAEPDILDGGRALFADTSLPLGVLLEFCPEFLKNAGRDPAAELHRYASWRFTLARLDERKRRPVPCTARDLLSHAYSELLLTRG